jgi:transcriptional regulator with XRE-family HTH domain
MSTKAQISRLELGTDLKASTLKRLAEALDVSTDWLLGLSEQMQRPP